MTSDSQFASSYLIKTEEIDPEKCQVRIEEWCKYNSSGSKSIGKVNRTFQIMPLIDLEIFV